MIQSWGPWRPPDSQVPASGLLLGTGQNQMGTRWSENICLIKTQRFCGNAADGQVQTGSDGFGPSSSSGPAGFMSEEPVISSTCLQSCCFSNSSAAGTSSEQRSTALGSVSSKSLGSKLNKRNQNFITSSDRRRSWPQSLDCSCVKDLVEQQVLTQTTFLKTRSAGDNFQSEQAPIQNKSLEVLHLDSFL